MKKVYRLKKKNVYVLLTVTLVILAVIFYKPFVSITSLMRLDYSYSEAKKIYKSGKTSLIKDKGYNQDIINYIDSPSFKDENIDTYYLIKYFDNDNFVEHSNALISKGYSSKKIDKINSVNDETLYSVLEEKYVENIDKYLEYDFFKSANLERYLNYFNGNYKDTVVKVNIGLDKPYYEDSNVVTNFSDTVLVNKYNKLDSTFVPSNLTLLDNCSSGEHYLSADAKKAYDELCKASLNDDMKISVNSSYRSYESQEDVYNYYLKLYGKSYVEKYVATPGYSEHQTGLCLDVKSLSSNIFRNSKEYEWMLNNAYKYGFILRYPKGKNDITGYSNEEWHFRYVGVDIAKYIYDNDITYDEYYAMFIDK